MLQGPGLRDLHAPGPCVEGSTCSRVDTFGAIKC